MPYYEVHFLTQRLLQPPIVTAANVRSPTISSATHAADSKAPTPRKRHSSSVCAPASWVAASRSSSLRRTMLNLSALSVPAACSASSRPSSRTPHATPPPPPLWGGG